MHLYDHRLYIRRGSNTMNLLEIEEIAYTGLKLNLSAIGDELDLSDEYLIKIRENLKTKLNKEDTFESIGNIAFSIRHEKENKITDAEWIEALRRCIDNLTPNNELNIERIHERTNGQFEDTIKLAKEP